MCEFDINTEPSLSMEIFSMSTSLYLVDFKMFRHHGGTTMGDLQQL